MKKWRIIVIAFVIVMLCAEFNVPTFTQPAPIYKLVLMIGLMIVWCICDAVDALKKDS